MISKWLKSALLIIFIALLGLAGGWLTYDIVTYRVPTGAWQRIGILPGKPSEILGDERLNVYVRTTDGNLYVCSARTVTCEATTLQSIPSSRVPDLCNEGTLFASTQPPGEAIDKLEYSCVGYIGLSKEQFGFVALTDNSVWEWIKQFSEYEIINLLAYLGGGLVIGFLAGIILFLAVQRRLTKPEVITTGQ